MTVEKTDPLIKFKGIDAGGGDYYYYDSEPFTGTLVERNDGGIIDAEREFVNGCVCGLQKFYFDTGELEAEYYEKFNVFYGTYKKWDINGNLIVDENYGTEP